MVKMIKLLALAKFGSLRGSTSVSLKIRGISEYLKVGFALILSYLLTDLLRMQTNLALVRPGSYLNGHTLRFYHDSHKSK